MATQTALISNRESWGRIHVSGSIAIYSTVQSSTARALPNDRDTELVVCINELVRNAPLFNSSNRMFVMHSTKLNKMKECECLCTSARTCSSMKKKVERNGIHQGSLRGQQCHHTTPKLTGMGPRGLTTSTLNLVSSSAPSILE
jgi:hypothetical protein